MDKIKILIDQEHTEELKGALPLPNFNKLKSNMIEVSSDFLKEQIQANLLTISKALAEVKTENTHAKIKEARFTLGFTVGGEVGLFSIAKGSASGTAGIEFVIEFT